MYIANYNERRSYHFFTINLSCHLMNETGFAGDSAQKSQLSVRQKSQISCVQDRGYYYSHWNESSLRRKYGVLYRHSDTSQIPKLLKFSTELIGSRLCTEFHGSLLSAPLTHPYDYFQACSYRSWSCIWPSPLQSRIVESWHANCLISRHSTFLSSHLDYLFSGRCRRLSSIVFPFRSIWNRWR